MFYSSGRPPFWVGRPAILLDPFDPWSAGHLSWSASFLLFALLKCNTTVPAVKHSTYCPRVLSLFWSLKGGFDPFAWLVGGVWPFWSSFLKKLDPFGQASFRSFEPLSWLLQEASPFSLYITHTSPPFARVRNFGLRNRHTTLHLSTLSLQTLVFLHHLHTNP